MGKLRCRFCMTLPLALLLSCPLTACVYSAASSSAQMIYNRHTLQKNLDDSYTSMKAYHTIDTYGTLFQNTHITIATFNDSILLAGQTPHAWQKTELEKIVKNVGGSRTVYNYLEMANPSSSLTRTSDSWITAKIKSQLIAINEADPTQIKVVTENGTVYLMGIVLPDQAEIAVNVAKETNGVQSVVKIFSYLRISKE